MPHNNCYEYAYEISQQKQNTSTMPTTKLYIKNMVCPRCIMAVDDLLSNMNIAHSNIKLGEVELHEKLNTKQLSELNASLKKLGFEIIDEKNERIASQIKSAIVAWVHMSENTDNTRLSDFLCNELNADYSHLSKLFSETEGTTIEKYYIAQKIEKAKELLSYNELNINEIAYKLSYSSVAHLSAQFKKTTGLTPTQFRNTHSPTRKALDQI